MSKVKTWIQREYYSRTLFQKMMLYYIILLCVPTFLVSGSFFKGFSRRLNAEYHISRQDVLEQKKNFVQNSLSRFSYCVNSFQSNSDLIDYVDHYDFTTANGACNWLNNVKPVFQRVLYANQEFSNICIWRVNAMKSNDPRYVRNAIDNPEIREIEPMNFVTKKFFLEEGTEIRECHVYGALYNSSEVTKAGYVEMDCSLDFLLGSIDFLKDGETLYLLHDDRTYDVRCDEEGGIFLRESGERKETNKNVGFASISVEELGITLDYYYVRPKALSNITVTTVAVGLIIVFLFFTLVYYAFYRSVTIRVMNLTRHMMNSTADKMLPYDDDPNQDEIGMMVRVYNETVNKVNRLNDQILQKERTANQAQYYALQSQIHPHFLYNTLENIDMLIEVEENEKASRMIALFGKILRYNLSRHKDMAPLAEEIGHIKDYLKLYSFRMQDSFQWEIDMEPECDDLLCPYCMMQPVVENCFKHGFADCEGQFWVHIRVKREQEGVRIEVEDNGIGITKERLEQVNQGLAGDCRDAGSAHVGLENVNGRIKLMCGSRSGLWISPTEQGCLVTIWISD